MHWQTKKRVKDSVAIGLLTVPPLTLASMARGSDRVFRRAGKAASVTALVGGLVVGTANFIGYKKTEGYHDSEALESTIVFGALGAIVTGISGGIASISRSAIRR